MTAVSPVTACPLNLSSISASDIATVKNASDREKIGGIGSRVWDKISDMLFGTDREETKKCLFDLYLSNTRDARKSKRLLTLQSLAADGYQARFQQTIGNRVETYALPLDEYAQPTASTAQSGWIAPRCPCAAGQSTAYRGRWRQAPHGAGRTRRCQRGG